MSNEINNLTEYVEGEIIFNNKNKSKIKIPSDIIDLAINKLKDGKTIKTTVENVEEVQEVGAKLYEIILKPELQEGLDNGTLLWNNCSVDIRNAKTGRFAGKINFKESELHNTKTIKQTVTKEIKPSLISDITKSICSISGQVQLAEISKKLDVLNNKIDEIKEEIWSERIAKLIRCNDLISDAIKDSKFGVLDKYAKDRVNNCIIDLMDLKNIFSKSINDKLKEDISISYLQSLKDSFTKIFDKDKIEYNKAYINEIRNLLNEYSFLLDCYSKATILLAECHQVLYEYDNAKKYYCNLNEEVNFLSKELSDKLIYLLDINNVGNDEINLMNLEKSISKRCIPIKTELVKLEKESNNIRTYHNNVVDNIFNSEIRVLIEENN